MTLIQNVVCIAEGVSWVIQLFKLLGLMKDCQEIALELYSSVVRSL